MWKSVEEESVKDCLEILVAGRTRGPGENTNSKTICLAEAKHIEQQWDTWQRWYKGRGSEEKVKHTGRAHRPLPCILKTLVYRDYISGFKD